MTQRMFLKSLSNTNSKQELTNLTIGAGFFNKKCANNNRLGLKVNTYKP